MTGSRLALILEAAADGVEQARGDEGEAMAFAEGLRVWAEAALAHGQRRVDWTLDFTVGRPKRKRAPAAEVRS